MDIEHIRNFCIVAHIDHGKSTLADRFLQLTGAVSPREFHDQLLDSMDIERERGITIKASAVTMTYRTRGQEYQLNLIDTPGHVDFHYEVSRAMTACEAALLVVDATQGVQAQTLANAYLALDSGLEIIPVINKIDLAAAQPQAVAEEIEHTLGIKRQECFFISAKTGVGVPELLEAVVTLAPPPADRRQERSPDAQDGVGRRASPAALIFDSHYDEYRGVICYVRVFAGDFSVGQRLRMLAASQEYQVINLGKFTPKMTPVDRLSAGEVGYIIANIRQLQDVTIGDTITDAARPTSQPLPGYKKPMQMVFCDLYPGAETEYSRLRTALEKLRLNDASFTFTPQSSPALGFGFRCGFLGLLHMEIVQERLERENDLDVVQTAPTVSYEIVTTAGEVRRIDSPAELPDYSQIAEWREPMIRLEVIVPTDCLGLLMELAERRRCKLVRQEYISPTRLLLEFRAPLAEIVYDFYDQLKGISHGYATMDYDFVSFEAAELVKIDILINKAPVDALSIIVHRSQAEWRGRKLIQRLRQAIPRHQFEIPLQVAIGGKIIARETIKAFRKDVLAKLYGGDVTRKMKVLKRQKEGKKRLKAVGNVNIPQEAFLTILDTGD